MPNKKKKLIQSPCKENESCNGCDRGLRKTKAFSHPRGKSQSCHQCRQSIFSSKGIGEIKMGQTRTKCSSCTRYWCENCLKNRYGLERSLLNNDSWKCPVCNNICNCSVCRRKNGKLATGILTPVVRDAGFSNVSEFLEKGTNDLAKCLQWKSPETDNNSIRHKSHGAEFKQPAKKKRKINKREPTNESDESSDGGDQVLLKHPEYSITYEKTIDFNEKGNDEMGVANVDCSTDNTRLVTERRLRSGRVVVYSPLQEDVATHRKSKGKNGNLKVVGSSTESSQSKFKLHHKKGCSSIEKEKLHKLQSKALEDIRNKRREAKIEVQRAKMQQRQEKKRFLENKRIEIRLEKRRRKSEALKRKMESRMKSKKALQEKFAKAKKLLVDARKKQKLSAKNVLKQYKTRFGRKEESGGLFSLEDDSPAECKRKGVADLPPLPSFQCGVADWCVSMVIFICEFLHTFSSQLDIAPTVIKRLVESQFQNSHCICKIYVSLLTVIAKDSEQLKSSLQKANKENKRDVKKLVCEYLRQFGVSSKHVTFSEYDNSAEQCVVILDHLCHSVLQSSCFASVIEDRIEKLEAEKKEVRLKKSRIIKELKSELESACHSKDIDEQIEMVKTKYDEKLDSIQSGSQELSIRGEYLGRDRFDRVYWKLMFFPGILVETLDDEGIGKWSILESDEALENILESLHNTGMREAVLFRSLKIIQNNNKKL